MDNETLSIVMWVLAGVVLVTLIMRRRNRKTLR
jgi:hypothetical protein